MRPDDMDAIFAKARRDMHASIDAAADAADREIMRGSVVIVAFVTAGLVCLRLLLS